MSCSTEHGHTNTQTRKQNCYNKHRVETSPLSWRAACKYANMCIKWHMLRQPAQTRSSNKQADYSLRCQPLAHIQATEGAPLSLRAEATPTLPSFSLSKSDSPASFPASRLAGAAEAAVGVLFTAVLLVVLIGALKPRRQKSMAM